MGGKQRFVVFLNTEKKAAVYSIISPIINKDEMNFQMGGDRSVNYSTSSS